MKVLIPAILALAAAGCVDIVEKEDLDALQGKFDKLNAQVANKNDLQTMVYDALVQRTTGLEKKVGDMDIMVKDMKAQIDRLQDIITTLQGRIEQLSKNSSGQAPAVPGQPAVDTPKGLSLEDILTEIETILTQLRGGKIKTDEAVTRLKPWAQHAAPRIVTELRGSLTRFDYTKQLTSILAKFPPAELKVPLTGALKDRTTRDSAAWVVGATGDKELSKILEEYLAEGDEDFRLSVGDALVRCRNGSGIPLLLGCLKSDQGSNRTIAIAALKRINRGEDLGYKAQLSPEANAAAIKSWEEWSDKFAKTVFE